MAGVFDQMNATNSSISSKTDRDLVGIARTWHEAGIAPIPIQPRSKKPSDGEGWNQNRYRENEFTRVFRNPQSNIGALWGRPSDHVCDIDIDSDFAKEPARRILPQTYVYGRERRPNTHYLIRIRSARTMKWKAGDGTMILELRATGTQSLIPGSIHPDGDRYCTEKVIPLKFAEMTPAQAESKLNRIASIAILARAYPAKGSRHDYVHALTGALARSAWPEEEIIELMDILLDSVGDVGDRGQRERTVRNTIEHERMGDRVAGWQSLGEWLEPRDREKLKTWLRPSLPIVTPVRVIKKPKAAKENITQEQLKIDPELLKVPGLVGDLMTWAGRQSHVKQPVFDLATALMCCALATGNRYEVDGYDTPLQPYMMLMAPTGSGKESAFSNVGAFARRFDWHNFVISGFQSYHSMMDRLSEEPHIALWLWDEAGRKLKSAQGQSGPDGQVINHLLTTYGKGNATIAGIAGRHRAIPLIERPYLLTLAATQPESLIEALSVQDLNTGVFNRFILINAGNDFAPSNEERQRLFPSRVDAMVRRFREVVAPPHEFVKVRMSNSVYDLFRSFNERARRSAMVNAIWGRANQNALILAGLVAVGMNPSKPEIELNVGEWSIALVEWSIRNWNYLIGENISNSRFESQVQTVARYIREVGTYASRARQTGERRAAATGVITRSLLSRLARHLNTREIDAVLEKLIQGGEIHEVDIEGSVGYMWAT